MPAGWEGAVPDGCELIDLPEQEMLWFQSEPYEKEDEYGLAYSAVASAIAHYRPEHYGLRFACDEAPEFHYGASPETGCRQLVPAARIAPAAR